MKSKTEIGPFLTLFSIPDKIYIVGGFNGTEVLQSGEFYEPICNEWTIIAPMNRPRSGIQLVAHDKNLYAIGGNDGLARQTSGLNLKILNEFE